MSSLPLRKRAFKAAWRSAALKLAALELTRKQAPEIHLLQDELDFALLRATRETGASGAAIALGTGADLCCRASCGMAPPVGTFVDPDAGLYGMAFRTGEAVLCRDTEQDSRVDVPACRALGVRSLLVVPFVKGVASCGILELFSPLPESFSESHVESLAVIANRVIGISSLPDYSRAGYNREEVNSRHPAARFVHAKYLRIVIAAAFIAVSVIGYIGKLRRFDFYRVASGMTTRSTGGNVLPAPAQQVQLSVVEEDMEHTEARIRGSFSGADLDSVRVRASAGDARAAYDLGERYADGAGVKQDFYQAMSWFTRAATQGEASAQWKLGLGYLKGIGVPQDDVKAAAWLLRAANQAHIAAQVALSEMYFDGLGVPQDYVHAYTWATIAAQTTSGGKEYVKAMAAQMTPEELNEAEHHVTAWWEHRAKPLSQ